MNLKNWTWDHTKGLIIGLVTPMILMPLVIVLIAWMQDYYFAQLWRKFTFNADYQTKILTISCVVNLIAFYFFLNRERYNLARGIILGTLVFAPYVIYIKFF